jgi:hypothetical protein
MFVFIIMIIAGDSYKMCKRKSLFGVKSYFTCPEPGQTPDMVRFAKQILKNMLTNFNI